jgi:hypothetical protein
MISAMFAALNCSVSCPLWLSTMSLPSPGFHTNVLSPAPVSADNEREPVSFADGVRADTY